VVGPPTTVVSLRTTLVIGIGLVWPLEHITKGWYERERDCFYYIIIQTYAVGLHSRRHPIEIDAGTRPFASLDAPIS